MVTATHFDANFGNVPVGTPEVVSGGGVPVPTQFVRHGYRVVNSHVAGRYFYRYRGCPRGLPAGGFCKISITFTPESVGSVQADLFIEQPDGVKLVIVALSANGQ